MAEHDLRLDSRFTSHHTGPDKVARMAAVREAGLRMAVVLAELCPSSPELTLAVNDIDHAVMKANAAIARH